MGQVLHGCATTTHAVRTAIQRSKAPLKELAARYGLNHKTVAKWRKRAFVNDAPMGPKTPHSTVLSSKEEAIIVAFRKHTLLPLDDCLYALQATIPHLTRSSLHRCLKRHAISCLPEIAGDKVAKKPFKRYPIGYFHLDIAEVRTEEGKLYLFVAIDRTSKFVFAQLHEAANVKSAVGFLQALIEAVPYTIHIVLTDNGIQFGDMPSRRTGPTARYRLHMFDRICREHGIEHRLTKPNHPWTNGQVERMNRTLKEATVRRYHYETHQQLREHLEAFLNAYNFAKRLVGVRALDSETNDEGLRAGLGTAWPWRGGYVCGVSVAYYADNGIRAHYFPLRHPDSNNFDRAQVFAWLKDLVASDVRFITQNGLYDWGWLRADGDILMPPSERLEEIGAVATLVDENRFSYGLDALCAWRGLPGKDTALLQQAVKAAGLAPKRTKINAQAHIWQLPARDVGAYAEADAANTLALWEDLDPVLDCEKTREAYRLEIDLLPMVHEMRRRGIRIDQTAAEQARDLILRKRDGVLAELAEKLDAPITMGEIGSPRWKAQTFDKHGIAYPRTAKGNPSFRGGKTGWMVAHPHWLPQLIARATKYDGTATRFLEGHILDHIINGRVHSEIHSHRSDDGSGACSLRFSYSDRPLQQMPSRDKDLAPLVRGVFLPEQGEVWAKPDISQQEFRFVVHYAVLHNLPRAKEAADLYRTDPDADFHAMVADMTGLERESAKAANFAKIFGAGPEKFAEMIGKSLREARAIYHQYDRKLPFISRLSDMCQREAKRLGHTELYDGARRHWDRWEAPGIYAKGAGPCSREEAQRRTKDTEHPWFGRWLRRVKTHTAMNALIQGSAARHTKLWMRACWREGIVPLLQMHDALECSVATREQGELVARLGCEAVRLEVPMRVDLKFGKSWGDAKHEWEEIGQTSPACTAASAEPDPTTRKINGAKAYLVEVRAEIEPSAAEKALPPLAAIIGQSLKHGKICCPFHDDREPSCHIYNDHFHCFGCSEHGDAIDWLMMVEGLDRAAAIELLANWQGPISQPRKNEDNAHTFANAMRLWEQAQPITGTPAIQYLAGVRRIDTGALPAGIETALRFHPRCPFGPGTRHPCLLALMRDGVADAPTGIQRIALTPEVLAGGEVERRMLGRAGAVKLWPAASPLVIGEGIETVLAAATRIPYRGVPLQPAWSTLTSGKLSTFPVLPGVERLIILVDHDINGAGQLAATVCSERWSRAGRTVVRLTPARAGADFNDLIMPE